MILFHVKANGQVTTTPSLVPQGSSMQDLVVLSELDYALCTIKLEPSSGLYIPDILCDFIETDNKKTLWTAKLPPEAARVPGLVRYQLLFTAADGTQQPTLSGTFNVPKGTITNMPTSVKDLERYTIEAIYTLLANIYAKLLEGGGGAGEGIDEARVQEMIDEALKDFTPEGGGSIGSISLVDDGEGNFTIVTTGGGTINLVDDGEGNFTFEVA